MTVSYFGFNIHQNGDCVEFSSDAGTGAALSASDFSVLSDDLTLSFELRVDGAAKDDVLKIKLTGTLDTQEYELPIQSGMYCYELKIPGGLGEITSLYISPNSSECVINAKRISFH